MTDDKQTRDPKPIPEEIQPFEIPIPGLEDATYKAWKVTMDDSTMTVDSLSKARKLLARFQNPNARAIANPEERRAKNAESLTGLLKKQLAAIDKKLKSKAKSLGIENPLRNLRNGTVDAMNALGIEVPADDAGESTNSGELPDLGMGTEV